MPERIEVPSEDLWDVLDALIAGVLAVGPHKEDTVRINKAIAKVKRHLGIGAGERTDG